MPADRNIIYLQLILDSVDKINLFIADCDYKGFILDEKTQSAVIMQLQIIGELAKKISTDVSSKIDLPWKYMAGLRDMVAHDYFSLDLSMIWKTLMDDIPDVKNNIHLFFSQNL